MTKPSRPNPNQQGGSRWEFLWWGFGKEADQEPGFEPSAAVYRRWRFGPFELRIYQEPRRPQADPIEREDDPSQPRLPGP